MSVVMEKIDQMSDICAIGLCVWMFASWLTHIITCLADGSWGFLVAGALFFPVAWIHGTGVWLGVW